MSGGLYSTSHEEIDKTYDPKKIKPYGDTMNDGKTQLSFTLPVPCGEEAVEAAKQLLRKMGFENPQLRFMHAYGGLHGYPCPQGGIDGDVDGRNR